MKTKTISKASRQTTRTMIRLKQNVPSTKTLETSSQVPLNTMVPTQKSCLAKLIAETSTLMTQ